MQIKAALFVYIASSNHKKQIFILAFVIESKMSVKCARATETFAAGNAMRDKAREHSKLFKTRLRFSAIEYR